MNQNELLFHHKLDRYAVNMVIIDFQWFTAGHNKPEGTTKVRQKNFLKKIFEKIFFD